MRVTTLALLGLALGCGAAQAQTVTTIRPVVVETRHYSTLLRDPATTPDINLDPALVGAEVPATVDVYALTEDLAQDEPVVSIERRLGVREVTWTRQAPVRRAHRGVVLRVKG